MASLKLCPYLGYMLGISRKELEDIPIVVEAFHLRTTPRIRISQLESCRNQSAQPGG
jgi:hypothetical protein